MVEVQVDFEYYGNVVAKCSFANVVMRMVGIGIQLVICIYSLVVFLETPNSERKGRGPYIVMSFVILVISAIPVALDSSLLFRQLREATSGRRFITILGQDISSWEVTVSTSLLPAYILVADGLLLYRSYIICRSRRWLLILPVLTFLACAGIGTQTVLEYSRGGETSRKFTNIFTIGSVITNVFVTASIIFQLIRARRKINKLISGSRNASYSGGLTFGMSSGVTTILIESALPLSFCGIAYSVASRSVPESYTTTQRSQFYIWEAVFGALYFSFAALSPQMIIFRVTTGRSFMKLTGRSSHNISGPIEFRPGTRGEATFEETQRIMSDDEEDVELDVIAPKATTGNETVNANAV